jgi:ABC-type Fe3+/spermidine/putrescine transport system ATPase subunit
VVPPERRGMSMIFQSYAIWPNMTVEENVAFGLKLRKLPREEIRRRTAEMLEVVKLNHLAHRYPAELSGGQQQRVALARALARAPRLLLLDEPFSATDRPTRRALAATIAALRAELAMPTILVSHDIDDVASLADQIAVLENGRIAQMGPTAEVMARPASLAIAALVGR